VISDVTNTGLSLNRIIAAFGRAQPVAASGAPAGQSEQAVEEVAKATSTGPVGKSELTEEETAEVQELRQRDAEVRQHEQAHKAAAGPYARGGPSFSYEQGPDGRRYAVEGNVSINLSEVPGNPQATIRKMQQVRQAALAPANPSSKDRQVAAKASAIEQQARAELAEKRAEEAKNGNPSSDSASQPDQIETDPDDASAGASPLAPPEAPAAPAESLTGWEIPAAQASSISDVVTKTSRASAPAAQVARLDAPFRRLQAPLAGRFIDVTV